MVLVLCDLSVCDCFILSALFGEAAGVGFKCTWMPGRYNCFDICMSTINSRVVTDSITDSQKP